MKQRDFLNDLEFEGTYKVKSNSLLIEAVPNTTPNISTLPAVLRLRGALAYRYQFVLAQGQGEIHVWVLYFHISENAGIIPCFNS